MAKKLTATLACVLSLFIWVGSVLPASAQTPESQTVVYAATDINGVIAKANQLTSNNVDIVLPYYFLDNFPIATGEIEKVAFDLSNLVRGAKFELDNVPGGIIYSLVAGKRTALSNTCENNGGNFESDDTQVGFFLDKGNRDEQKVKLEKNGYIVFVPNQTPKIAQTDSGLFSNCIIVNGATNRIEIDFTEVEDYLAPKPPLEDGKFTYPIDFGSRPRLPFYIVLGRNG